MSDHDQLRDTLRSSGVLGDALPQEQCAVVVPSRRLPSGQFAMKLYEEGLRVRALGHGSGKVKDAAGKETRVKGMLVLAVNRGDVQKVERRARLCGVTVIFVEHHACTDS